MTGRFLIRAILEPRNRLAADAAAAADAVGVVERAVAVAVAVAVAEVVAVVGAEVAAVAMEAAAVVAVADMPARVVLGRTFRFSRVCSRVYWSCIPRGTGSCVIPRRTMPLRIRIPLCRVLWSSDLPCGLVD